MADEWTAATWADVEEKDFVRVGGQIFRVDYWENGEQVGGGRIAVALYRPDGTQRGFLNAGKPVELRTRKDGALTPAGTRFDGLSPAGARALKEQLGAELAGAQVKGGATFQPYICQGHYGAARQLADHLSMFHGLYTGEVKQPAVTELRRTHKEFHTANQDTFTGARTPHIHNDEAFRKESL